jgi:hypothetical protein
MIIPNKYTPYNVFVGSMVIDFPNDNMPLSTNVDDWKKSASLLSQEDSFCKNGAPSPQGFKNKTEWAEAVFYSMASFS